MIWTLLNVLIDAAGVTTLTVLGAAVVIRLGDNLRDWRWERARAREVPLRAGDVVVRFEADARAFGLSAAEAAARLHRLAFDSTVAVHPSIDVPLPPRSEP